MGQFLIASNRELSRFQFFYLMRAGTVTHSYRSMVFGNPMYPCSHLPILPFH